MSEDLVAEGANDALPTAPVVALDMVRIAKRQQLKPYGVPCRHQRFDIFTDTQTVKCRDCGEVVSPFLALTTITEDNHRWWETWTRQADAAMALHNYQPHLRAVKKLEHTWRTRKYLPCCPHCHRGVEADALAASGTVHRSYDERQAERAREDTQSR